MQLAANLGLIDGIQADSTDAYKNAGYTLSQKFTEGFLSGLGDQHMAVLTGVTGVNMDTLMGDIEPNGKAAAYGLTRVPYNDYPALLHEGERVLTASQAREMDAGGNMRITISGNSFTVREDADVEAIAQALMTEIRMAQMAGTFHVAP